jgi:hypothetical protein
MTRRSNSWLATAALLLASASSGLAEDANRSWTDPPASAAPADETVTYPDPPKSSARSDSAPAAALADPEAPPARTVEPPREAVAPSGSVPPASSAQGQRAAGPKVATGGRAVTATTPQVKRRTGSLARSSKSPRPNAVARASQPGLVRGFAVGPDVDSTGALPRSSLVERGIPESPPPYRRIRSVREALDAGLTVTRVRTFQLPDGRRIEVESEPDPRTSLDLVVRPY